VGILLVVPARRMALRAGGERVAGHLLVVLIHRRVGVALAAGVRRQRGRLAGRALPVRPAVRHRERVRPAVGDRQPRPGRVTWREDRPG